MRQFADFENRESPPPAVSLTCSGAGIDQSGLFPGAPPPVQNRGLTLRTHRRSLGDNAGDLSANVLGKPLRRRKR